MRLVQFTFDNSGPRIGVYRDGRIFDAALLNDPPRNLSALIEGWDVFESTLQAAVTEIVTAGVSVDHPLVHAYQTVELLAPSVPQGIIICVGMNYPDPAAPLFEKPEYPVLFLKDQRTIHPPHRPILLPSASDKVFCEGELAVIIGRSGKHIPENEALDHVFGYTIANDVGARDLESRTSQWATGKLPDTFLPLGPLLVTASEITDINDLAIKVTINNEPYLEGSTSDMIFSIAKLIAYISAIKSLQPGDLIITGSPKGLGRHPAPIRFLNPGDTITIAIDSIGELTNPVIEEKQDG
jgi:2-keto-4-pentenoate hydratase/2-oxohepta-3-ene-1,7-dioic acid hydratase in catechol pathway